MPLTANKMFRVHVSEDRLTATLSLNTGAAPEKVCAEEMIQEVKALGLVLSDDAPAVMAEFAASVKANTTPEPIVIARGAVPEHDQNGVVERLYQHNPDHDEESGQSHYDRSSIVAVSADQPLLRLVPPVTGRDGVDVYGKPIARKLGRKAEIKLGANVRLDGDTVHAACDGSLGFKSNKVWVDSQLDIRGDLDFSVGNVDFNGDVVVGRNVLDKFKVRSTANIAVQGMIEAAEVHAGGDLICQGGMTGKEKGRFCAQGNIASKYITNAEVEAGGDINVRTEVVNCQLRCQGRLHVESGPLVGGHALAAGGARVKFLGSEAGVATLIEVGVDPALRAKCLEYAPQIELRRQKAAKVRQVVEPLLQNQKHLNNAQKEKATELLYQAYELEEAVEQMIAELRQACQRPEAQHAAEVEVTHMAYTGVIIRFPHVEGKITEPVTGPVKFLPRKENHTLKVVAVNPEGHTVRTIRSGANRDDFWETLNRLLNPPE